MQTKLTFADFYTLVWSMVPQVWKDADDEYGKSLQILLYTMSQHMYYYFYNKTVHLEELFDPDLCPEKYLKFLAGMIGWKLIGADPVSWREQIKAAPLLYKVRGTKRGLLLAEKLVGYSIFMSELYRDHIGDSVPKERIFNNTPDSIKQKPWFRKNLISLEGELLGGQAESDQFDSFNTTSLVKLDANGNVIRPRLLSSTRKLLFNNLSTTELYNNLSGKYSLARYAKLPRINVVLKYEHDLGEELADGSIKPNNFTGALDLLLQFKPFHVFIENLEVRYSLAEFVFDQPSLASDLLNVHEGIITAVHVDLDRAEHTITFSPNPGVNYAVAVNEVPESPLSNRGVISSIYKTVVLSTLTPTKQTSLYSLTTKSLPVKAAVASVEIPNVIASINDYLVTNDNITTDANSNYYVTTPEASHFTFFNSDTGVYTVTQARRYSALNAVETAYEKARANIHPTTLINVTEASKFIRNPGHCVIEYDISSILSDPILDFQAMLSSQHNETSIDYPTTEHWQWTGNLTRVLSDQSTEQYKAWVADTDPLWPAGDIYTKVLANNYIAGSDPATISYKYTIGLDNSVITGISIDPVPFRSSITTTYDTQSISSTISRPWDLGDINTFCSSASGFTSLSAFKKVYDNVLLIVLHVIDSHGNPLQVTLDPGADYYFDSNQHILLNSATIAAKLGTFSDYTFLNSSKLDFLYLSRKTSKNETSLGIQSRGFRYKTRINTKFSRQYAIDTLPQESISRLMPTEIVSVDGKTKTKTVLGTKQFKVKTDIYNRSSLKNEQIDNYTVVNKDPLSRSDQSKWTVYSPEFTAYYLGDQKITNNWWGNYYQAKFPDISAGEPAFVPYSEVDKSGEAQVRNANSNQWMSALKLLNLSNPKHFLATRKSSSARAGIWKRNSCKFISIPFIRSRRDALQVFRRDTPTFTRSEESTDYLVNTSTPIRVDNYKYVLADGTDVSSAYFTPGFSEITKVTPTMDRFLGQKATISQTDYTVTFPGSDTYYNNFSSDVDAKTYFSVNDFSEYAVKSSLYAGNIPVSRDPSLFTGFTEGLDKLELMVSGLEITKDIFVASAGESSFVLSKNNVFPYWIEVNTGASVGFGYYPPFGYVTAPNIKVLLNGFALSYGIGWTITFDRIKTLTILVRVNENDVITVEYETIPGETDIMTLPTSQLLHSEVKVLSQLDMDIIGEGNRYFIDLPITGTHIPCISWYSKVTDQFINYGISPLEYRPLALYEDAYPNVVVSVNGVSTEYKADWNFVLRSTPSAAIALNTELSLILAKEDIIKVDYFYISNAILN